MNSKMSEFGKWPEMVSCDIDHIRLKRYQQAWHVMSMKIKWSSGHVRVYKNKEHAEVEFTISIYLKKTIFYIKCNLTLVKEHGWEDGEHVVTCTCWTIKLKL